MKRGWCPSLYAPMASGDGLLVRVKPPGARLTPGQALAFAEACGRFGNGVVELTQRGNLQVRGLATGTVGPFAAAMVAAGLAEADPALEVRRVVMAPVLLGDDPGMAGDAGEMVAGLEAAFLADERLAGLPGKFALAVDAGGVLGGRAVAADLVAWTDGRARGVSVACRDVAAAPVGFLPYGETGVGAFGCAPPFGQMGAGDLVRLAEVAGRLGTVIWVSAWRTLLLGQIGVDGVDRVMAALGECPGPGFITDAGDARLQVTACPGGPACGSGSVAARRDAGRLRPSVPVHVSGCAKGCAHPGVAAWTLVGREGLYDVVRDGRAGDAPMAVGLAFEDAMGFVR